MRFRTYETNGRQWSVGGSGSSRDPAEGTYADFVRAGPKLLRAAAHVENDGLASTSPVNQPTQESGVEKTRMSSLTTVVPSTNSADTGRTSTNNIASFVRAIAAFIIASVYYGVVFLDLWLQVRRLNPTSMGEVSTSPTQPSSSSSRPW